MQGAGKGEEESDGGEERRDFEKDGYMKGVGVYGNVEGDVVEEQFVSCREYEGLGGSGKWKLQFKLRDDEGMCLCYVCVYRCSGWELQCTSTISPWSHRLIGPMG